MVGWNIVDSGMPGPAYWFFNAIDPDAGIEIPVGGMMQLDSEMKAGGAVPVWLGYIGVGNVDACLERLTATGGTVMMPATDIPGAGRIAMVTDPHGVPFYVMRGEGDEPSLSFATDKPRNGHCAWNELASTDPARAWAFYRLRAKLISGVRLLTASYLLISSAAYADIVVDTPAGQSRGFKHEARNVYVFKGVHYGQDISGERRFKPALPVAPWYGVRDANRFGDVCPQGGEPGRRSLERSEFCR